MFAHSIGFMTVAARITCEILLGLGLPPAFHGTDGVETVCYMYQTVPVSVLLVGV